MPPAASPLAPTGGVVLTTLFGSYKNMDTDLGSTTSAPRGAERAAVCKSVTSVYVGLAPQDVPSPQMHPSGHHTSAGLVSNIDSQWAAVEEMVDQLKVKSIITALLLLLVLLISDVDSQAAAVAEMVVSRKTRTHKTPF